MPSFGLGRAPRYAFAFRSIGSQLSLTEPKQVVLFTPGEEAADGYLGYLYNETISGLFGQEINGAVLLLERTFASIRWKLTGHAAEYFR